jgi:hypothetical protein
MSEDSSVRAQLAKKNSPFLNIDQAAHFLGVTARYLRKLRAQGKGPVWRRHARAIQYHIDDLEAWSAAQAGSGRP